MQHDERLKLAHEITAMIVEEYPEDILLAGACCSVARGEDREHSDIDLVFITKKPVRIKGMSDDGYADFLVRSTFVQVEFRTKEEVLKAAADIAGLWPRDVGRFFDLLVLYGSEPEITELLKQIREKANSLSEEHFRKGAGWMLLWVFSSLGKVRNAYAANDIGSLFQAATYVGDSASLFVAYLNGRWYRKSGFASVKEALAFEKLPQDYSQLMQIIYSSREAEDVVRACERLYQNCLQTANFHGIKMRAYPSSEELDI